MTIHFHHHHGQSILTVLTTLYISLLLITFRSHHFYRRNLQQLQLQQQQDDDNKHGDISLQTQTTTLSLSERLAQHAQSMSLLHNQDVNSTSIHINHIAATQNQQRQDPKDNEDHSDEVDDEKLRLLEQQQQQRKQQRFQKYPPHPIQHPPNHTMGICLLIKDDNDLLPEFIAYHYHTVDLRYLVVGVDPSSTQDPTPILDRFRTYLSSSSSSSSSPDNNNNNDDGFQYVVWNDTDYMPDWFLAGNYSHIPSFISGEESKWNATSSSVDLKDVLQGINNHRFRQTVFVGECIRHLYGQNRKSKSKASTAGRMAQQQQHNHLDVSSSSSLSDTTTSSSVGRNATRSNVVSSQSPPPSSSYLRYMAHIDTDEMLVVNPHFLSERRGLHDPRFANLTVPTTSTSTMLQDINRSNTTETIDDQASKPLHQPWMTLEASSVRQLLETWHSHYPSKTRSCRYLPRVLMGSTERQEVPPSPGVADKTTTVPPMDPSLVPYGFDSNKFESLRFKWHARYADNPINGFGKVILDLDELRRSDNLLKRGVRVSGIHQISPFLCDKKLPVTSSIWDARPLATYHYLGSAERHCGKDDPRRSTEQHRKKSIAGSKFPDGPWLDQWLKQFVYIHGLETSQQLLPEYLSS